MSSSFWNRTAKQKLVTFSKLLGIGLRMDTATVFVSGYSATILGIVCAFAYEKAGIVTLTNTGCTG
jgi:hypothetical protein